MGNRYRLSEMMQEFVQQTDAFFPPDIVSQGIEAQRHAYERMAAYFAGPRPEPLQVADGTISDVPVRRYMPAVSQAVTPVLFVHGGGWYLGSLDSHDSLCASLAHDCSVEVIAVDYRLAPDHLFPAGLNDVTAVYQALLAEDTCPVLMGDSAGGNLVAALSVRCRELMLPMAAGQVLIYPALAAPDSTDSVHRLSDAPMLDRASMIFCWEQYAGGSNHFKKALDPLLCPLLADDLSGVPDAAIFAAEYDPLRDDARLYADRLIRAGVRVHYEQVRGMVHGGLRAVSRTEEGAQMYRSICEHLRRLLRKSRS